MSLGSSGLRISLQEIAQTQTQPKKPELAKLSRFGIVFGIVSGEEEMKHFNTTSGIIPG